MIKSEGFILPGSLTLFRLSAVKVCRLGVAISLPSLAITLPLLTTSLAFGMWWAFQDFSFGQIWHWDPSYAQQWHLHTALQHATLLGESR